jgi:non-specific serine/threonine protein kinase
LSLPDVKQLPAIEQFSQYEAVQLFIERAMLVQPHFLVTKDNAPAIAQICFRLDGIPLAIELAAARVRALSANQIAKRLDDRFRLLTGGSRTALERHQTLRATIDWSYNLLSGDEKLLLRRLAVFTGGWTLEAAEQVCAGNNDISSQDVLDLLTHLVEKSLVIMEESAGSARYHTLETTRQYAREKLFDSDEGATLHDKHLTYFLDLAEQADKEIHGPDQLEWMDRVEAEHDSFRAALEWCVSEHNTESALRLLCALSQAWGLRDHSSERESWFDRIRALPEVTNYSALYARLLNHTGNHYQVVGDLRHARSVLEESQAIWLKLGVEGEQGLAEALECLGNVALLEDNKMAQSLFEQSFELYQKHGDQWGMAWAMYDLGSLAFVQGHYAEAEEQYMKSLAKFQELGDKFSAAYAFSGLGDLARFLGDYERARKFHEQNLEGFRELRGRFALAWPFLNLAWVSLHEGDYRNAKALFEESLILSNESRNKGNTTLCLAGFASVLGMTGKPQQAARLFGAVESLLESIGPIEPTDQKDFDHYVAAVRAQLDQAAFAKAWAEGRTMTLEQAITFALEKSNG